MLLSDRIISPITPQVSETLKVRMDATLGQMLLIEM